MRLGALNACNRPIEHRKRPFLQGSGLFRVLMWHKAEHEDMHEDKQASKGGEGVGKKARDIPATNPPT